ncbi:hypothetical protein F4604DRAFT_1777522 [Suillus subluteus]|nr:hypothetical protein F4604DRAFT_1777522 [Suillus subluteus]
MTLLLIVIAKVIAGFTAHIYCCSVSAPCNAEVSRVCSNHCKSYNGGNKNEDVRRTTYDGRSCCNCFSPVVKLLYCVTHVLNDTNRC